MLRKIFFAFAVFFLAAPQVFPQQDARKFLIVVQSRINDRFGFRTALWRSLELKRADMDVRVIFQGEAVAFFLGKEKFSPYEKKSHTVSLLGAAAVVADPAVAISTECESAPVEGMICQKFLRNGVYISTMTPYAIKSRKKTSKLVIPARKGGKPKELRVDPFWEMLAEFTAENIPYTICSLSATHLGVYDKLKALGLPLSDDPTAPVAIAPFINDNYQVISY